MILLAWRLYDIFSSCQQDHYNLLLINLEMLLKDVSDITSNEEQRRKYVIKSFRK